MNLVSLQFETTSNYENNLAKLISLINLCEKNSLILAPELCLSGFDYENFLQASLFSNNAIEILTKLSDDKTICITMIMKKDDKFYNTLFVFHNKNIIHTQSKVKLFTLGNEDKYFTSGDKKDIKIFEINGIKISALICFELRFVDYWKLLQGSDIILIPAMWGKIRKQNYESLTNSLAILNQCYVIASDSTNNDMASSSGIISPFGKEIRDDNKEIISIFYDKKEIKKMRKYLDVKIK